MNTSSLFIIGLDALDKDLVEAWALAGDLPNFRSLMDRALQGDIENPIGLEAGSCWPTFYFGLQPSETSQFDGARHFDFKRYQHVSYQPAETPRQAIWTTLSKAGKLCGVIDAPYSYPLDDINGIKVVDRGAHVPAGGGDYMDFRTKPRSLADELEARFGPDPAGGHSSDFFPVDTPAQVAHFRDLYIRRIENKTELALYCWGEHSFDFFMPVFTEAHCVGHRCWHIHDSSHPDHDAELAAAVGDPVKDIYVALDRAVGRLVEAAGREVEVIVYLSHGMGPGYSGTRLLDRILARLDNRSTRTQDGPVMGSARALWRKMPDAVRRPLKPLRNRVSSDGFQPGRHSRRYFEVFANDRTGGIRLNLRGREAQGIVAPEDYDRVCEELIRDLQAVENAATGEPLATEILKVREHYSGEYLDFLPDILVTWNRASPIDAARSPKIGTVDKTGLVLSRSGDHRPIGRFYGLAEGIQSGKLNTPVRVEDFAPTISRILNVPHPQTDGRIIAHLIPQAAFEDAVQF